eukprot:SAG31_NODE_40820_length_279_cov_0.566667_1_plen_35_part_01
MCGLYAFERKLYNRRCLSTVLATMDLLLRPNGGVA